MQRGTLLWVDPQYDLVYVFLSNRTYPDSENLKPNEYADECVEDYLNHLRRCQFNLLPPRRQGLLSRMSKVIFKWSGKTEHNSNLSLRLDDLRRSAIGASDQQRDMRKIASKWIEYCRNNKEVLHESHQ